MQIDVLSQVLLPCSLFIVMFGIGLSLVWNDFKALLRTPKPIVVGMLAQLLLLPLLAWGVIALLGMEGALAAGVLLIALAPGGATSNLFSYLAKGDASLSIVLTGIASLVTPFTIPVVMGVAMNAYMGDQATFSLPVAKTMGQLLVITVLPVLLGMRVKAIAPKLSAHIEQGIRRFSIMLLALLVVLVIVKNRADMPEFIEQAGFATLLLNVLALGTGYQLAKWTSLPTQQTITLGFEVGIQNGTLALVVAGSLIGNGTMMIPAVIYSILMFITAAVFGYGMAAAQRREQQDLVNGDLVYSSHNGEQT